ncbi:hypothetical protein POVCU2_0020190 [Plasmodium ovale curtisi]|uniref:Uncharacterized protein n=1 Tax=Plasmodium ovale curtisi TaxID=864141 RepID=A0A1A8WBR9_PLAOA|nr:hypothetical protein POVCU2_0020190 [Plasmodium ovale curtisi]SBS90306.1 hypothetical protein POVCU1_018110 [Plasmodium ovale curtisi]
MEKSTCRMACHTRAKQMKDILRLRAKREAVWKAVLVESLNDSRDETKKHVEEMNPNREMKIYLMHPFEVVLQECKYSICCQNRA